MEKIDFDALIVPGAMAAGLRLGASLSEALAAQSSAITALLDGARLLEFGPVQVWEGAGVIQQIGVHDGYRGCIDGSRIQVGSTLRELVERWGPIQVGDSDELTLESLPGLCFEAPWGWALEPHSRPEDNLDARITGIFVHAPRS